MSFPVFELLPYAVSTFSLAACVWMFVLLKVELRKHANRTRRDREALEAICSHLKLSMDGIERKIEDLPAPVAESPQSPSLRLSMNMSHRAQVLRMSRRGERPEQIAAALGLPAKEVELLLKVHRTTLAALA
jgi:hypothetical protein